MVTNKKSYKNSNIKNKRRSKINGGKPPKEAMTIFVEKLTGERDTIKLEVESTDTIGRVKVKIQDKFDYHTSSMHLDFDGKQLEDNRKVGDYNIQNESILHLNIIIPKMHIVVKTLTGKTFTLEVKSSDTTHMVKAKIQEIEGIPIKRQKLVFSAREISGGTLADYNIQDGSIIYLVLKLSLSRVLVNTARGEYVYLGVQSLDTIGQVKDKINHYLGIPINHQHLYFNHTELLDTITLEDLNIENDGALDLFIRPT
jgi:ubiquitin C